MAFMWLIRLLLLAAVASLSYGKCSCIQKLRCHNIIPDYADSTDTTNIKIEYDGGNEVHCGNRIPTTSIANSPKLTFDATKKCLNVTIILFDPEYPEPRKPFLHWMVANVNTKMLKEGNLDDGDVLAPYFPPRSTNHRYVFFIYCQSQKVNSGLLIVSRFKFQPREFAENVGFTRVVAANYFKPKVIPGVSDPV